jgi:hypothetical protein
MLQRDLMSLLLFFQNKESRLKTVVPLAYLLHAGFLLGLLFDPEDEGDMFVRNIGCLSPRYTAVYPRSHRCENLKYTTAKTNSFFPDLYF